MICAGVDEMGEVPFIGVREGAEPSVSEINCRRWWSFVLVPLG
jgi:hypothetical protein